MSTSNNEDCQSLAEMHARDLFVTIHNVPGHRIHEYQITDVGAGCDVVCDSCDFRVELQIVGGAA